MKSWKRPLIESLVLSSALTLSVIYVAQQQILVVLNWIGPVFFVPFHGAALLSGNSHEPSPWLFHTVLFLQILLGRFYRRLAFWPLSRWAVQGRNRGLTTQSRGTSVETLDSSEPSSGASVPYLGC